jgi:YD repeat-containing protein
LGTTTDPLGHTTTNVWDLSGNLTSRSDALGNVTHYAYDATLWPGQPIKETDALGNVTTNAYDAAGHLLTRTDALGQTTTYTYDANGKKLTEAARRTSNGASAIITTTYTYDAMGRVLQVRKGLSAAAPPRTTTYTATSRRSAVRFACCFLEHVDGAMASGRTYPQRPVGHLAVHHEELMRATG